MSLSPPVRRALISVSDKQGLAEFARGLAACQVELYSTGGTRAFLQAQGLSVIDVADYTGFPEMLDGRVKTLHPKVHGGILCRYDRADDMAALEQHGIRTFELIVVNLYPFEATLAKPGVTLEEAVEQIDIGGPSLVRGAAKNHAFASIVTSPQQYAAVLRQIQEQGRTSLELRRALALAAYQHTSRYDHVIAGYLAGQGFGACALESQPADGAAAAAASEALFPARWEMALERREILRYGENPHQRAAVYAWPGSSGRLADGQKLHGKELSYNNLLDLASAWAIARSLPQAAATVIKHNNPCGAAADQHLHAAARKALEGDPVSAFGGVLGFNAPVDAPTAEVLAEPGRFIEAIVAPGFTDDALRILTTRPKWKDNVRLVAVAAQAAADPLELRAIDGGYLVQETDVQPDVPAHWKVVTRRSPTTEQQRDLAFAWGVVRHVKSNAIVVCADGMLLGTGAGQMSRVDSVRIALEKAGARARGAVLASDAFFPFPDSIEIAAAAGIAAVIEPGGSKKDPEVIAACDQHGLAMLFTGQRHFKH